MDSEQSQPCDLTSAAAALINQALQQSCDNLSVNRRSRAFALWREFEGKNEPVGGKPVPNFSAIMWLLRGWLAE
jgi:hypothetical protein